MGKKSSQKKIKKQPQNIQNSQGTRPQVRSGMTLDQLSNIKNDQPVKSVNIQNISYEMVGDLHKDVRKILIMALVVAVCITGIYLVNTKTDKLLNLGEKAAVFMKLSS